MRGRMIEFWHGTFDRKLTLAMVDGSGSTIGMYHEQPNSNVLRIHIPDIMQGRQKRGGWGGPSRPTFRGKILSL